jgi:hypothetical protein
MPSEGYYNREPTIYANVVKKPDGNYVGKDVAYGQQGVYSGRKFGKPTKPSGKVGFGPLPLMLLTSLATKPSQRRTVTDDTGDWWRESNPGSGVYWRFGVQGGLGINMNEGRGQTSTSDPVSPVVVSGGGRKKSVKSNILDKTPINRPPGLGPYPKDNIYFPMLTRKYTAPSARNLKDIMPANPALGGKLTMGSRSRYDKAIFPGVIKEVDGEKKLVTTKDIGKPDYSKLRGLLYQPWTTQYQQAFVRPNLWNYTPLQLRVGFPARYNPFGSLDLSYEPPPDSEGSTGGLTAESEFPGNPLK